LITQQLIEQIEGEASICFDTKENRVEFATIVFPHFRGIESMLEGKNALDALVITPRVCGICGHAHLMATVRALEDAYKNAGHPIILSKKVEILREFTLIMEMIQNHFKWIYLSVIPELSRLVSSKKVQTPLKAAYGSNIASKAIALFGGQWPHSSYMLPGGVTSDPTNIDIVKAQSYVDSLITFFEQESLGTSLDHFLAFKSCKEFASLQSDISFIEEALIECSMETKGFAYDRFLVIAKHSFTHPSKLKQTRALSVDSSFVSTSDAFTDGVKSYAKNAHYKGDFYETGPLSRLMSSQVPIVKNIHRRFKDSAYSRVMARVFELALMLKKGQAILKDIDISEKSYTQPIDISKISGVGEGVVEAPRGPLLHRVTIKNGIIQKYNIITPTQFNIGSSTKANPTPAQKAMVGLTQEEAVFVFRSFDVCSVCTTH
jgi:Ni,Fe-hydrogenase I large subunit